MDIKKILLEHKRDVDRILEEFLEQELKLLSADERIDVLIDHARTIILSGGKRIRPIMMLYGYKAAGGQDDKALLRAAISIELIHSFLLMHDDVIDQDEIRHNTPTLHAFAARGIKRLHPAYDADHYGKSAAIVIGDVLYALGNKALFTSDFPPHVLIDVLTVMQDIVADTGVGEMQDVNFETQTDLTEKGIMSMYERKTARYTFEGPLRMGAVLAGDGSFMSDDIVSYTTSLGRAFQLQDDLLGVFGDQKKTGKSVGSDIAEGKMTVLMLHAYNHADQSNKKQLLQLVGKSDISAEEVCVVQDLLKRVGSYDYVRDYAQREVVSARAALAACTMDPGVFAFLDGLALHLEKREV